MMVEDVLRTRLAVPASELGARKDVSASVAWVLEAPGESLATNVI
jgi:hypothetical protein